MKILLILSPFHHTFFTGVKLLDGFVNDRIEGMALSYAQDIVDIYSASWGPTDDGLTVDGPGRLAQEALRRGILKVRFYFYLLPLKILSNFI